MSRARFVLFAVVGGLGFLIDAAVLLALVHGAGVSRLWSRIPSFLVAATATWALHRRFTFGVARATPATLAEWGRFLVANAMGNGLNLLVYALLVGLADWAPIAALVVASALALALNYAASARWVFARE